MLFSSVRDGMTNIIKIHNHLVLACNGLPNKINALAIIPNVGFLLVCQSWHIAAPRSACYYLN